MLTYLSVLAGIYWFTSFSRTLNLIEPGCRFPKFSCLLQDSQPYKKLRKKSGYW